MSVQTNGRRITREDLEAAFQKVVGEGQQTVERSVPKALVIGAAGVLATVTLAFLAGAPARAAPLLGCRDPASVAAGVDTLLRRLARTAFRRAMGGEHWAWWVIALSAFVFRRARRRPDLVTTLDLRRGERYEVRLIRPGETRGGVAGGAGAVGDTG